MFTVHMLFLSYFFLVRSGLVLILALNPKILLSNKMNYTTVSSIALITQDERCSRECFDLAEAHMGCFTVCTSWFVTVITVELVTSSVDVTNNTFFIEVKPVSPAAFLIQEFTIAVS